MAKRNEWIAVIFLMVFIVGCVSPASGFSWASLDTSFIFGIPSESLLKSGIWNTLPGSTNNFILDSIIENTIDDILRSQQQQSSGIFKITGDIDDILRSQQQQSSGIFKITGDIDDILRRQQWQQYQRTSDDLTRGTWQTQFQIGETTYNITYHNVSYATFGRMQEMDRIHIQMERIQNQIDMSHMEMLP